MRIICHFLIPNESLGGDKYPGMLISVVIPKSLYLKSMASIHGNISSDSRSGTDSVCFIMIYSV